MKQILDAPSTVLMQPVFLLWKKGCKYKNDLGNAHLALKQPEREVDLSFHVVSRLKICELLL
jgi:hypothetical protein